MDQTRRPSRRKHHIIYKTTCLVTGRYYIGMHSTDDLEDGYLGSGVHLTRSLKKHGKEQHVREIVEHLPDRNSLKLREEELVTEDLVKNDVLCMNLIKGGGGSDRDYGVTDKTRELLSIASKRTPRTPEWRAKIAAAHKGKIVDPEVGLRHSQKMKGRKSSPEHVAARTAGQLASEKFKKRYRPFAINGVVYQNGREAVTALGIKGSTLTNRLLSPNWPEYQYLDAPKDPSKVSSRARGEYRMAI